MTNKVEMMSPVDAAWLSMEEPTNPMMVNGIITFDQPLDMKKVWEVLENRWLGNERFRQRVVRPAAPLLRPYWETDPTFNLRAHVHRVALPAPGDKAALENMVSDLMSMPLDFSKPPWQLHIIENYGQGCAVMARLHHCIADGMALVAFLLTLTDFSPEPAGALQVSENGREPEEGNGNVALAAWRDLENAAGLVRGAAGRLVDEGRQAMQDRDHAERLLATGAMTSAAAGRLLLRSNDPPTIFKGKLGVRKRAAWSRPIPLAEVKTIRKALGGTVNDVLVSSLTGALRRYLIMRAQDVSKLNFRAAVPVNLRPQGDDMTKLGNRFGLVFLSLPVNVEDPLMRLVEVRRRMDDLKRSGEAPVTLGILGMMGVGPEALKEFVVRTLEPKATAVLTNVPGPPLPLYLAGQEIKEVMAWVPQAGRLGLGLSILTYNGAVFLGVATDAGLVPDPHLILEGFYQEHLRLLIIARAALQAQASGA